MFELNVGGPVSPGESEHRSLQLRIHKAQCTVEDVEHNDLIVEVRHFAGQQIEIPGRVIIERIEDCIFCRTKQVQLRCPHHNIRSG